MTHLLKSPTGHLFQRGGHLVASTGDCQDDCCCTCLNCTGVKPNAATRIVTLTVGNIVSQPHAGDSCSDCSPLNGAFGQTLQAFSCTSEPVSLCQAIISSGYNCGSDPTTIAMTLELSAWIYYNGTTSAQTLSVDCDAGGNPTAGTISPNTTIIIATMRLTENTGTDIKNCYRYSQTGKITCPFSGLSLALVTQDVSLNSFRAYCDSTAATLTVGVA
jgi:hypothetical protein